MLSQHSLNKGRSKRLVSAVAALSLFFGAAHVAPTASAQEIGAKFSIDEAEQGYRITDGSKNVLAELFSATSGSEKRLAYCNELEVNFHKTDDAYAAKWEKFPGDNNFAKDETVRRKVNWIAANSYPAVSYETVLQKAGVTSAQVSKKSVIAQTQAAIWNLGSGFNYKGLAHGQGTAEEQQNAKKVYEYLLGPANVGRAESTSVDLQVGFKGKDTATRQDDNGTFGPFTLDTNADSVEVTAETGQVVDKNGNAFPANEIKKGQEFYFKAAETAGEAKLIAKAASSEVNGALIISKKEGGNGHHQTLIVTHDKEKTKEAELYIKWEGTNARLSTTAHKKGDEHSQRVKSKGGTIIDVVAYEGLIVGKKYTLKGQMYERVKQEDGTYKGVPTDIKAQKEFTPTQRNDEVHLEFEIPEGYAGKTLVVFEEAHGLDANGKDGSIATHTDINDENQTIYVNQPYQDMSSDSSAAKTGSAGAMFAGSSKCFSGGAAGGSSKKEDKNKGSLGDLFAGSSSLFGGDKDKDKGGSDSNNGSTNGGNGQDNGGSNTQNGSNGGTTDSSSNKDKKDNGSTGGGDSNGNGGGNGDANGGSDTKTGSNAGGDAGSGGGAGSSGKDKKDNGSNTSSSGDNKGDGKGEGGSDGKSGSGINSTSDTKGGSAGGAGSSGNGKGDGNGGSTAGSSGEGKGQGNGGANGGSDTQNGSDPENKNGSAALAGSTSGGADCGALALGALVIGGLVLTATGFSVLPKNAAPAPLAGAADPKSDTKGAAPAAGDPNNKNATNSNTKGAEPKEKGVAHKDPNTSKMDVKSASPAKSNSALANTGVSGILIMLAIAAVAAVAGGALIFFGRRKKN
ncbi:VaFE repeat-containing surface-anchored protein [Corynebacterium matruchotii]|uniref:LPXTG-motif cell wall anchor domain protein n=1 Tax=Corynebacterium matruchotii ATCC 33806 TaxID=566549 RepID=C0E5X3_9CORY|nr:VaFE repeat-containing surface-anchored protein [Corynebacterium matruchotii]EEG26088.1 LPXTG-motif cell wall anchor domain protein [Corynebacterium matruchotii ATCC 33806]